MRQQFLHPAGSLCGQPREHILEVDIRVVPIHASRLDQAHDGSRSLARAQATGKQPVRAPKGNGPDLILDPVVVHGQLSVVDESGHRHPTPQAVVQRPGRR